MDNFRWKKHFGGHDSNIGRDIRDQPRKRVAEKQRALKVPPPPQFERRNYPEKRK